jgi:hypothetical protein
MKYSVNIFDKITQPLQIKAAHLSSEFHHQTIFHPFLYPSPFGTNRLQLKYNIDYFYKSENPPKYTTQIVIFQLSTAKKFKTPTISRFFFFKKFGPFSGEI